MRLTLVNTSTDGVNRGPRLPFSELPSLLASGCYEPRWIVGLEFARGCTEGCRFCGWRAHGGGVRRASEARMRTDVAHALEHEVTTACVLDSALNSETEHLARLTRAIGAADPDGRLGWRGFLDVHRLDGTQLELLRRVPIQAAEVGLYSLTPAAMALAGRRVLEP